MLQFKQFKPTIMRKNLFLIICLLLTGVFLNAQENSFRKDYDIANMDITGNMIQTESGDFVFVGTNVTWLPITGNVTRIDMNGNIHWSFATIAGIATTLTDVIEVSPGMGGGYILAGQSDPGAILIRINNDGDLIWAKRYQYPNHSAASSSEWFNKVIFTKNGQVLACGGIRHFWDGVSATRNDSVQPFAIKVNFANGDIVWDRAFTIDVPNDDEHTFYDVAETNDGYIFVGYSSIGDGPINDDGDYRRDALIIKTDFSGNMTYARKFGSTDRSEIIESATTLTTTNVLLGGSRGDYGFLLRINGDGATPTINFGHRYRHEVYEPNPIPWLDPIFVYSEPAIFHQVEEMSDGNYGVIGTYFKIYALPFEIHPTGNKINQSNGAVMQANTFAPAGDNPFDIGIIPKGGIFNGSGYYMFMTAMGYTGYKYHVLKTDLSGGMNNPICPEGEYNPVRSGYTPSLVTITPGTFTGLATASDLAVVMTPIEPEITTMCEYKPCDEPPTPTVVASPQTICTGQSSTLTASGSGSVIYHFYTQAYGGTAFASGNSTVVTPPITTTYYVDAEDVYNAGCFSLRTSITVTVEEFEADILTNDAICGIDGSAEVIIIQSPDPNPTAEWSTGHTGLLHEGLNAGSYFVTVTDQICGDIILDFEISNLEDFDVNIEIEGDECDGFYILTAVVTGVTSDDITYEWNNNNTLTNPYIEVFETGTYMVNAAYGDCRDDDQVYVYVLKIPTLNEIADKNSCGTFTFPEIIGTNLTGDEAYYTGPGGTGTQYDAGMTINYNEFAIYPVTIYVYDELGECSDEQSFQLTISEQPVFALTDVYCNAGNTTYTVEFTNSGGIVSSTAGTVSGSSIINIPISSDIVITVENGACVGNYPVSAPDCACEGVTVPVAENPQSQQVCFGSTIPALTVQTPAPAANYEINWYNVNLGGSPLASNTESFTPSVTQPGTYIYYVEVVEIATNCTSDRIQVSLTINPSPSLSGNTLLCEISATTLLTVSGGSGTAHPSTAWTSGNPGIATVNNGTVTAVSVGSTTITYMDSNSCTANANIQVSTDCDNLYTISGTAMYAGRVQPHPVNGTEYADPVYTLDSVLIVLKDNNGVPVANYTTGIDGSFAFYGVAPGDYTIEYDKIYNEYSSWVNSVNVTDYTWFKTYILNQTDDYYSFLRFDDLYWYAMNVTCEQPPMWNVGDYNQIKFKILNFGNYEVHTNFINNPNTFCYGAWQGGEDEVTVSNQNIEDHVCLLIAYGDYNASATGYIYRETGSTVHDWEGGNKSIQQNYIYESSDLLIVNSRDFVIPVSIMNDKYNVAGMQLHLEYPSDRYQLKHVEFANNNKQAQSKLNLSFDEMKTANSDLASTDFDGNVTLFYSPTNLSKFDIRNDNPVFYLHFSNLYANNNVEKDFYLFGSHNVFALADFQELENVGFVIPQLKNNPAGIDYNNISGGVRIYPNPTNDFINIEFELIESSEVQVSIYDITGRQVISVDNRNYNTGEVKITLPVDKLSPGYYSARINKSGNNNEIINLNFIVK